MAIETRAQSADASPAKECGAMQEHKNNRRLPSDILTDLSGKIPRILIDSAIEILIDYRNHEYVKLAVSLLDDALRYDALYPHARGCNESIYSAFEKIRDRERINDSHRKPTQKL